MNLESTSKNGLAPQFVDLSQQRDAVHAGMWVFLATEALLFGGWFFGFAVNRYLHPQAFAEAATHLDLLMGSINTVVILTSGLTMACAEIAGKLERRRLALALIFVTLLLGLVFLGIKGYEYHHEYTKGLIPISPLEFSYKGAHPEYAEMFFNTYFVLTGLHALHMIVGVGLLCTLLVLVYRWKESGRVSRQMQVMGMYWSFIDIIWLFIFSSLYLLHG